MKPDPCFLRALDKMRRRGLNSRLIREARPSIEIWQPSRVRAIKLKFELDHLISYELRVDLYKTNNQAYHHHSLFTMLSRSTTRILALHATHFSQRFSHQILSSKNHEKKYETLLQLAIIGQLYEKRCEKLHQPSPFLELGTGNVVLGMHSLTFETNKKWRKSGFSSWVRRGWEPNAD